MSPSGAGALEALDHIEILGSPPAAVRLHLSGPVAARAVTLAPTGDHPARIYLDLPGTALAARGTVVPGGAGPLLRVRAGQFDELTTRVVLDLAHPLPFTVDHDDALVVVRLGPGPLAPPPSERRRAHSTQPAGRATSHRGAPALVRPRLAGPQRPLRSQPVVVLDAGHGGRDPGAAGVGGVLEKDVALALTRRVASRLSARLPVHVVMTRTDDTYVSIPRRLRVPTDGTALFLSLHANACPDPSARGVEVFYGGGRLRTVGSHGASPAAALLARTLSDALGHHVGPIRGRPRPADFRVLVRNPVPSALVEVGYLTHPEEALLTQDTEYQDQLAEALTDGIVAFLRASTPVL